MGGTLCRLEGEVWISAEMSGPLQELLAMRAHGAAGGGLQPGDGCFRGGGNRGRVDGSAIRQKRGSGVGLLDSPGLSEDVQGFTRRGLSGWFDSSIRSVVKINLSLRKTIVLLSSIRCMGRANMSPFFRLNLMTFSCVFGPVAARGSLYSPFVDGMLVISTVP